MWVVCGYFSFVAHLYLIDVFLGDNQRTNIIWVHNFFLKGLHLQIYQPLHTHTIHNWEDLCIHVRNQQTYTFDKHKLSTKKKQKTKIKIKIKHNLSKNIQLSTRLLLIFHYRFANLT